jgi:hypothetical protein
MAGWKLTRKKAGQVIVQISNNLLKSWLVQLTAGQSINRKQGRQQLSHRDSEGPTC